MAYRQTAGPPTAELATGGTDEVGNRKTLRPDSVEMGRAL